MNIQYTFDIFTAIPLSFFIILKFYFVVEAKEGPKCMVCASVSESGDCEKDDKNMKQKTCRDVNKSCTKKIKGKISFFDRKRFQ